MELGKELEVTLASLGEAEPNLVSNPTRVDRAELLANSSSGRSGITSGVEEKAINLLGSGVSAEQTASALGVSPSRIAQLLAEKYFADKVSELRYQNLQRHNTRDNAYDSLEDMLLEKLERAIPLLIRPESILKAMQVVNGAKRRGCNAPQTVTNQLNVVALSLPAVIAQRFQTNLDNQVVRAGEQDLLTMPSGNLLKQVEAAIDSRVTVEGIGEL